MIWVEDADGRYSLGMPLVSIVLLVVVLAATYAPATECSIEPGWPEDERSVACKVHPGLPAVRFRLLRRDGDMDRVEVYFRGHTEPDQVLDAHQKERPYGADGGFELLDMNFDGYRDVRVLVDPTSRVYEMWLFDPARQRFVYDRPLSIESPQFVDAERRELWSVGCGGNACTVRGVRRYRYAGGKLVTVREFTQTYETDRYVREIKTRKGGKLVLSQRCVLDAEQLDTGAREPVDPDCPKR